MIEMKILVRVPNWIGDSVLALPAVESIKHSFPEARLWIAAQEWVSDLFASNSLIDGIIPLPESRRFGSFRRAARKLRGEAFDTGILLTNSLASALLFYLARIPQRWGYAADGRGVLLTKSVGVKDENGPRHQVHYYLDLVSGLGLKPLSPEIRLSLPPEEKEAARERLYSLGLDLKRPLVILSPGASYGPAKRWPASRFAELAGLFEKRKNAEILIIGSADEAEIAASIRSSAEKRPATLTGQTTLRQLLGLISQAALFVSNDSGPMHLANGLRVPVVGIFGPTDPDVTGPFERPSSVVKKEAPCWPCTYRKCPYDHRCMMNIAAEDVFRAAEGLWR
jgi:heptosyltransferase II